MSQGPHTEALKERLDDPIAVIQSRISSANVTLNEIRAILDEPSVQWELLSANKATVPEKLHEFELNRWNWFTDYLGNMFSRMSLGIDSAIEDSEPVAVLTNAQTALSDAREAFEWRSDEFALLRNYLLDTPLNELGIDEQVRNNVSAKLWKLEDQKNLVIGGVDAFVENGSIPPDSVMKV